jgi:hypothetical protein
MAQISILFGVLLTVLGIVGFVVTDAKSYTALIPVIFGSILELLGVLVLLKPDWRKHLMHAAALVALIGLGGSTPGLIGLIKWGINGAVPDRPAAAIAQSIMAGLMLIYLILCIRSFIAARKARQAGAAAAAL